MSKAKKVKSIKNIRPSVSINDKKIFLILMVIFIIINILNFDPKLFLGGDNAHYLILAKSLITGQGYRDIFMPDMPAHSQYPPGFPILLAPFVLLFSDNFIAIKLVIMLLSVGMFYFCYQLYKHYLTDRRWILALLLVTCSPIIIMYSHYILSEIPYLFFSLLAIYLFTKIKILNRKTLALFIGMISALIATYYLRTVGITLLLAILIYLIFTKRYSEFVILLLLSGIFVALWQIRSVKIGDSGYFTQFFSRNPYDLEAGKITFSELISRFFKNFKLYTLEIFPKILLPTWHNVVALRIVGFLSSSLVLIGLISKIKKISMLEIYLVLFLIITFAWPAVWTGDRFLLPILPLLFYYLILGIQRLIKKSFVMPSLITSFFVIFCLAELLSVSSENMRNLNAYFRGDKMAGYPLDWQNYFKALDWIKHNTATDEVVISRKPQFTYLIANRKSFTYPFSNDENKFFEMVKKYQPHYLLFDRFYWTATTTKYLAPIVSKYQDKFQVLYQTSKPEMYVLRIDESLLVN